MNLEEIGTAVFVLYSDEVDLFTVEKTKHEISLEIFGIEKTIFFNPNIQRIFIHVMDNQLSIQNLKLFEYGLIKERKLLDFYNEKGWKTPKEKNIMFSNYKITDVKFGDISDIALETAVEKIAHDLEGVEIKTKGDKTYLIKNGKAIELKGEEFTSLVEKYVKGKTVAGLRRNKEMFTLISNLGIISEVTLTSQADDLSSIFG